LWKPERQSRKKFENCLNFLCEFIFASMSEGARTTPLEHSGLSSPSAWWMDFPTDTPLDDEDDAAWYRKTWLDNSPRAQTARVQRPRRQYGRGIDARRTAAFRSYPMEHSLIYRYLAETAGTVTKELLLSVVAGTLRQSPPGQHRPPPKRSQKRAKAGLVAWLDDNIPFVLDYLQSRPSIP
jgi:hypothetical protein